METPVPELFIINEPVELITLLIVVPPVLVFDKVPAPVVAIPPVPIVNKFAVVLIIDPPPAFTVKPLLNVAAEPV